MADEAKEPWIGEATFRKLFLLFCQFWMFVAIAIQIMLLAVWVMIFIQNIDVFDDQMGHYIGNDKEVYDAVDGQVESGYVAQTNIPKQLGGAVFSCAFAIALWVFILISLAADVAWRYPSIQRFLAMFHAPGLWNMADLDTWTSYFLWANAVLKLFIVTATGSTSFYGLLPNNPDLNTPLFCLWATFIYLVAIVPTAAATMVCAHQMKLAAWPDIYAGKVADVEAAAGGKAVDAYKAELAAEKEKQRAEAKAKAAAKKSSSSGEKK